MPKWKCEDCGHEFWGWGVYYKYRSGDMHRCPDCEGRLVQQSGADDMRPSYIDGPDAA